MTTNCASGVTIYFGVLGAGILLILFFISFIFRDTYGILKELRKLNESIKQNKETNSSRNTGDRT